MRAVPLKVQRRGPPVRDFVAQECGLQMDQENALWEGPGVTRLIVAFTNIPDATALSLCCVAMISLPVKSSMSLSSGPQLVCVAMIGR